MSTTITCEGIEVIPDNVSRSTGNNTNHSHGAPSVSSVLPHTYVQRQLPSRANRAASASPNTFTQRALKIAARTRAQQEKKSLDFIRAAIEVTSSETKRARDTMAASNASSTPGCLYPQTSPQTPYKPNTVRKNLQGMGRFDNLDSDSAVFPDEVVREEEEGEEETGEEDQVQTAQTGENEETITMKLMFHDKEQDIISSYIKELTINDCLKGMPLLDCLNRLKKLLGQPVIDEISDTIHANS